MGLYPKEKNKDKKDEIQKERRYFLKKATYVTPTLVALGALTKPTKSEANFGSDPVPPF